MSLHDEITFHLAKDEVRTYVMFCQAEDIDSEKYRSGRKVTCPAFHVIDLVAAFCRLGAGYTGETFTDINPEEVTAWAKMGEGILDKTSTAAAEVGVLEEVREAFEDDPRLGASEEAQQLTEEDEEEIEEFWRAAEMM